MLTAGRGSTPWSRAESRTWYTGNAQCSSVTGSLSPSLQMLSWRLNWRKKKGAGLRCRGGFAKLSDLFCCDCLSVNMTVSRNFIANSSGGGWSCPLSRKRGLFGACHFGAGKNRAGRFVADSEANKIGAGTYIFYMKFISSKRQRVAERKLLIMTGGSRASDRTSPFSTLEAWQQKLLLTVIDEAQQYGGDREVSSVAMLPATCFIVWIADQTPGGIAKGPSQSCLRTATHGKKACPSVPPGGVHSPHAAPLSRLLAHIPVVANIAALFQGAVQGFFSSTCRRLRAWWPKMKPETKIDCANAS